MKQLVFVIRELIHRLSQHPWQAIGKLVNWNTWQKILVLGAARTRQPPLKVVCRTWTEAEVGTLSGTGPTPFDRLPPLPVHSEPEVSIIIPVFNHVDQTAACLESILLHSGAGTYEVIVADDGSSDATIRLETVLPGLRRIPMPQNGGFLKNCNHAASHARGRFLVFLNNDTYVQPGWLSPLVSCLRDDPTVGLVGSRLIFPDGTLQEAGGIIWKDGSAANFGRGQNPTLPAFNYLKEVDYCSGASIATPRALWESLGGFDERYAPAYSEDSDYAFEVRRAGLRVVLAPRSDVVHLEGVSHGRTVKAGTKQYQVANLRKFQEKWGAVLQAQQSAESEGSFRARERSQRKKVVLFVDQGLPQYDRDAGSRTVFGYVQCFLEAGFVVKFLSDTFERLEPYASKLEDLGVEVLVGPAMAYQWKDWIRENGGQIDLFWVNRPTIAEKYLPEIRACSKGFVVYYGHDLHALRYRREFELTGEKQALELSARYRKLETQLFEAADLSLASSHQEAKEIREMFGLSPEKVKALTAYFWDTPPPVFDARCSAPPALLFVGGFQHEPNVDGMTWFLEEVYEGIKKEVPGVVLKIVGSKAPERLTRHAGDQVQFLGNVDDATLAGLYQTSRVAIVPLRYGAGLKGKLVEAMAWGIPVVGTTVAWEGVFGSDTEVLGNDRVEVFQAEVVRRLFNPLLVREESEANWKWVAEHYSQSKAMELITFLLGELVARKLSDRATTSDLPGVTE